VTQKIRPHLGDTVLELSAGIGSVSGRLMGRRVMYVAADRDALYLHALRNRFLRTPNVSVLKLDPEKPCDYANAGGPFDTVLCINVLEYVQDAGQVIASCAEVLKTGGSLVVLVPQGHALMGSLDATLGHKRRFERSELAALLGHHGFEMNGVVQLNKISGPAWWLYSRVLRRKYINKVTLKLFDKTVWFWRLVDGWMPGKGLTLVAVARKK
jgi:2-polyprenyl-3-methyl-5-hydroxy-6-metoxy-1,4-benzoquinol methylase